MSDPYDRKDHIKKIEYKNHQDKKLSPSRPFIANKSEFFSSPRY